MVFPGKKAVAGVIAATAFLLIVWLASPFWSSYLKVSLPSLSLGFGGGGGFLVYDEKPTLVIEKIGLEVPIVKGVSLKEENEYNRALTEGVALARGTAQLEAETGNSFIFGHSSTLGSDSSPYDAVFAQLPSLVPDDRIRVAVAGRTTEYRVVKSQSIRADEVDYVQGGDERIVTLVTCWPLGTSYKRWVVQATKI